MVQRPDDSLVAGSRRVVPAHIDQGSRGLRPMTGVHSEAWSVQHGPPARPARSRGPMLESGYGSPPARTPELCMMQFSFPTKFTFLQQNAFFFQTTPFFRQIPSLFPHTFSPRAFFTPKRLQLFGHISDVPSTPAPPPPFQPPSPPPGPARPDPAAPPRRPPPLPRPATPSRGPNPHPSPPG